MTDSYVLSIDQGTTGTKAHRLTLDGQFETVSRFEHQQIYPQAGWVEHDPEELIAHIESALQENPNPQAIGIANQGETIVAWDARTKKPIYNAIVWQDARSNDVTEQLKAKGAEILTTERAGLPLDPYFSASKFRWILDHVAEAKSLRREKRLRLGTSDAFFLDRLSGIFATDVTTASRTSLMNLKTLTWDPELCDLFGVPIECLPEIRSSAGEFGSTARDIPITTSLTDQQAALFGHGCREPGHAKITFGTGAFALGISGLLPVIDRQRKLATTIAWKIGDEPCLYAFEGGLYNAASAVNWARGLGLFSDYSEIERFDKESALSQHLVFVPALSGLACPYWDRRAAGLWLGLGLDTERSDLMQALLEGVALLGAEVLDTMSHYVPAMGALSVDGGMAKNSYFLSFLSKALNRDLMIPASEELTGLGTAWLTLIGAGLSKIDSLPKVSAPRAIIRPDSPLPLTLRELFRNAIERCQYWR